MEFLAVIPARGGSKGVPRKNIRLLRGKPLIAYSIEVALQSSFIDRVFVTTDDEEIKNVALKYQAEIIDRPADLAQDDTPSILVYQHAIRYLEKVKGFNPDIVVVLQPTSPLRMAEDIDNAIEKYLEDNCCTVVSVCEMEHSPYWAYTLDGDKIKPVIPGGEKVLSRQDTPRIYRLNGAVYVLSRDFIVNEKRVLGDDTRAYIMPPERSIDIDTELDFKLAELLISERK